MSVLYIEPFAGLAGDMLLSALCGLCDGYDEVIGLPEKLNLPDGKVEISTVNKNGIVCKHVKIIDLNEAAQPNGQGATTHSHSHKHTHSHDQGHSHSHNHSHAHRHLSHINDIIDKAEISDNARKIAKEIFLIIGKSESKVHDIPLEKIHFHEVSAVDSILDIVGCAVMLDTLNVEKTYSDPVCLGSGTVKTQHGVLPVPAPATADILRGIPTFKGNEPGEKTTPTGAAILQYLNPDFSVPTSAIKQSAYGPGTKDFTVANVVRVSLLASSPIEQAEMYVIETQLDDTSSEILGSDFQQQLLELGASDFYYTPIHMKKGRPGLKISVLTSPPSLEKACEFILEHTPTIGLRYYKVGKQMLSRNALEIETEYGTVKVKESIKPSGRRQRKIEYDSLREISQKLNKSVLETQELLRPLVNQNS
ncbi:nickel pincer cofactor biosynthesis protein LarC [Tunicatimonas pelagia]|uniref:nickel pincer cofactor biosynthesis protein LarC n=1 Tax=Tunicatimonas pelagia TaxID=931531 RepID=UPI002664FAFC|nr:nickel pincer cofactor biosynthesis protein LarC [Tunicatimonas pelagia]WKN43684.1 nickel pincer cofactor biosynthesis protein LarC [Tunicatimonas pelagia]